MNTTNDASSAPKILIVGGYGSVGYRIAKLLAPDFRARITIAGRNLRKAEDLARTLGHDSQARMIDVNDSRSYTAALEDVGLVIMCLDLTDTAFAQACVTRGIHYVDITASLEVIERLSLLHDLAAASESAFLPISAISFLPSSDLTSRAKRTDSTGRTTVPFASNNRGQCVRLTITPSCWST